ncbi:mitochondrial outer membrane translocase complex, subunit Tom22 [Xylaria sp. CBS 124048]|nr:mitochondrial outer membrane translocase complex, subunit Tom22 [Xylaria sp. CBS 124048]
MVKLEELTDDYFLKAQPGPEGDATDDDAYTDTDSEISEESEYDPTDETLAERLYALRDMVPPQTRGYIASTVTTASDTVKSVLSFGGKTIWVISSSALLLGIPWALLWSEENHFMEMEKEMKMREMGGELLTAGTRDGASQPGGAAPSLEAKAAL